jgi:hypothetical protein
MDDLRFTIWSDAAAPPIDFGEELVEEGERVLMNFGQREKS